MTYTFSTKILIIFCGPQPGKLISIVFSFDSDFESERGSDQKKRYKICIYLEQSYYLSIVIQVRLRNPTFLVQRSVTFILEESSPRDTRRDKT